MNAGDAQVPIVCDLSSAADTGPQRLAEYQRLFGQALVGRERTADGVVRFQLRADDGIEDWVRDLAAREKACCAFFDFTVTTVEGSCGGMPPWSTTTPPARSSTSGICCPTPPGRAQTSWRKGCLPRVCSSSQAQSKT